MGKDEGVRIVGACLCLTLGSEIASALVDGNRAANSTNVSTMNAGGKNIRSTFADRTLNRNSFTEPAPITNGNTVKTTLIMSAATRPTSERLENGGLRTP